MTLGPNTGSHGQHVETNHGPHRPVLAPKPGRLSKLNISKWGIRAAAASRPDLAPAWPTGMPSSWTHIFPLGFYLIQTSQQPPHKLESNFTLNVVPVRLPSHDKVPVCPCLIHEEHLLRVSDETWQWHKMKVDLGSIGKIVKNVGRGSLADNRRDNRADTWYKICKKYNTWTSCLEAPTSDIKDVVSKHPVVKMWWWFDVMKLI